MMVGGAVARWPTGNGTAAPGSMTRPVERDAHSSLAARRLLILAHPFGCNCIKRPALRLYRTTFALRPHLQHVFHLDAEASFGPQLGSASRSPS